ncbi:MAG: hypothetical protein ACRCUI_04685 [Polymorphobacter sp.]
MAFGGAFALIARNAAAGGWPTALAVSASRIFPFGGFGEDYKTWLNALAAAGQGRFLAESLATLESLCALILIFLFGLALRRRFKVA